ncbi:MAG: hypothetical protein AAF098_17815 [Pseudomonadota bacterium]
MKSLRVKLLVVVLSASACSHKGVSTADSSIPGFEAEAPVSPELIAQAQAPLLEGLGDFTHPISAKNAAVQRYFDQGMIMAAGFNHAEAVRSFRAAQRLDPSCAICLWGEAMAIGPNINVTAKGKAVMLPEDRIAAFKAIQQAVSLAAGASQRERDYIMAQSARYNGQPDTDREPLDAAYADAMRSLAAKYPSDDDAQAMFAEALMNTMPWDYWLDGENPKPATTEVINTLETVIARNPQHPLSLHLYIHAVEASSKPERAEDAADMLANLVPGSGHLVHMPSHIYWRIGRYSDASEANVRAAAVDEAYIAQCNAQGFYPALYYPHNIHFLWASASMEGRSAVAIAAGEKVAANVRLEQIRQYPTVEFFRTIPLLTWIRFGRWQEILDAEQPPIDLEFSNAIWRYARAVASARSGHLRESSSEIAQMKPLLDHEAIYFLDGNDYPASAVLSIAHKLAEGELAQAKGDLALAVAHYRDAVAKQDALPYTEPPFWYYPSRQSLGYALLLNGEAAEAERVYLQDLKQYPRNGWSQFGLIRALEDQGKTDQAKRQQAKFDLTWALADVDLTASVL